MDLSKPEIHWIIIGCLASIVFGAGTPFFAILFGDMLKLFTYEASEAMKQARIYALAFGGVGFAFLLSMSLISIRSFLICALMFCITSLGICVVSFA